MYHSFEVTRRPPFPLDVFAALFEVRCIDWDGKEIRVRTPVHNPALHPGRIDTNPKLQRVFRDAILNAGGRAVTLGHGEIIAIRLQPLQEVFEKLLENGTTIYSAEIPKNPPTVPPEERVPGYL